MRVLSVNVGLPREVVWRGKPVTTGIFKEPVAGRVPLARSTSTAIARPTCASTAARTRRSTPIRRSSTSSGRASGRSSTFGPGTFGENLTTQGLLDSEVSVGDRFRVGTAELVVTQPRIPCFKLGIRMGRDGSSPSSSSAGSSASISRSPARARSRRATRSSSSQRDPRGFRVTEVARLFARDRDDVEGMRRAADLDVLPESWREHFRRRLARAA